MELLLIPSTKCAALGLVAFICKGFLGTMLNCPPTPIPAVFFLSIGVVRPA